MFIMTIFAKILCPNFNENLRYFDESIYLPAKHDTSVGSAVGETQ